MRYWAFFLILILGTSCEKRDVTEDASLFGDWSDELVKYTFRSDGRFGKKALAFIATDTLNLDSSYGDYQVYNNGTIVFNFDGFKYQNGNVIDTLLPGPTWTYEISGNVMTYETQTIVGRLTKQ